MIVIIVNSWHRERIERALSKARNLQLSVAELPDSLMIAVRPSTRAKRVKFTDWLRANAESLDLDWMEVRTGVFHNPPLISAHRHDTIRDRVAALRERHHLHESITE